jgi:hypothetical protein
MTKNYIYIMEQIPTYRIVIDENDENTGVDCISLVEQPAIEEVFLKFNSQKFEFQTIKDKQLLFGPLMIPNKRIYRSDQVMGEYFVFFTQNDIDLMVRKFAKNNFNNNISFEHMGLKVAGTLVENFIVKEGMKVPGFENIPVGTWMGTVYIEDKSFWNEFVKNDIVKGFSIEVSGILARQEFNINIWKELQKIIDSKIEDYLMIEKIEQAFKTYKFETYNDYPKAASENAARAIRLRDQYDLKCGTLVGWQRANQLAKGENISRETIARMSAFERHRGNSTGDPKEACGPLMWLAWGGDEGIEWAQRKLKQIDAALNSSAYQTLVNKMSKEEFIVEPKKGETEEGFIGRCIGVEVENGYDQNQAAAICYTKWSEK